jgi:hypothetical protein
MSLFVTGIHGEERCPQASPFRWLAVLDIVRAIDDLLPQPEVILGKRIRQPASVWWSRLRVAGR